MRGKDKNLYSQVIELAFGDCGCDFPLLFLIAPKARTAILTLSSCSSSESEDGASDKEGDCMAAANQRQLKAKSLG